jgi:hypothetical protein
VKIYCADADNDLLIEDAFAKLTGKQTKA